MTDLELASLLDEAATVLRKVRESDHEGAWPAFGLRDFLPDELEGSALLLRSPSPLQERVDKLEELLRELKNSRPLLLYGKQWIQRIEETLKP